MYAVLSCFVVILEEAYLAVQASYIVMTYIVMVYIGMAYTVVAYMVLASIGMAYIVMARVVNLEEAYLAVQPSTPVSISASPAACLLDGCRRAGTQKSPPRQELSKTK